MTIGSAEYFVIMWSFIIIWGLSIAALAIGGLLTRRWVLVAIAAAIAAAGILLSWLVHDAMIS